MLPMIWAAILRVSVERFWKARCTTGIMRAREGASMKWMKCVLSRRCRLTVVLPAGSCRAASSVGTMAVTRTDGRTDDAGWQKWRGLLSSGKITDAHITQLGKIQFYFSYDLLAVNTTQVNVTSQI